MKTNLTAEFEKLADSVRAHPMLELLDFKLQPPATDEAVREVEAQLKLTIPAAVKSFYLSSDGVSLCWRFRPDLPEKTKDQIRSEFEPLAAPPDSLFDVAGNINLLPLRVALLDEEYALPQDEDVEGEFDFEGKVYSDNEFCRMLRPFDIIDDFFCMAYVVRAGVPDWKVMLLSDYWIGYDHSRVTWLDDYLKFVISTWGIKMARNKLFSKYRGDRDPPLAFDESLATGLVPPVLSRQP